MTTTYEAPHDEVEGRYWSATRIALAVVVVLITAMWVWIYIFAPRNNPDRLDTRSFATAAEAICVPVYDEIFDIPRTSTDTTIAQRAGHVDTGTSLTRSMINELKAEAEKVTDERDQRLLEFWFADWDAYLADRDAYHQRLVDAAPDANRRELAFTLTERASGGNYTRTIQGFAEVNDMTSCGVPGDI